MSRYNESSVIIATHEKNCLQTLDLVNEILVTSVGECGSIGGSIYDGHRLNQVRLRYPFGIAVKNERSIYVSLGSGNYKILAMTIEDIQVTTDVISTDNFKPRYLSYQSLTGDLYATMSHGFGVLYNGSPKIQIIAGSPSTDNGIGELNTTGFNTPCDFVDINTHTWFITDLVNNR